MQPLATEPAPDTAETQAEMHNPSDPIEEQRRNFISWLQIKQLSVRSVATAAGMTETPLRFYKSGKTRDLRHENKIRIAQAFGTTVADIFGDSANPGESSIAPVSNALPMTVPVMARIENDQLRATLHPAAFVEAPPGMALSGTVYAIRCPNSDMEPRFRRFEILLCEPTETAGEGDDCAIHTRDGHIVILRCHAYIKGGIFFGKTFCAPDQIERVTPDEITKISRVVGILMGV
mgnify:CR=1 FL=1